MAAVATQPERGAASLASCPRCHRPARELHYSVRAHGICCERCLVHLPAVDESPANPCPACGEPYGVRYEGLCWPCWLGRQYAPRKRKRQPPARTGPEAYARLVERVWQRLAKAGPVYYIESGHIAGYCPVCRKGTVTVRFVRTDSPRTRLYPCELGCSEDMISEALR